MLKVFSKKEEQMYQAWLKEYELENTLEHALEYLNANVQLHEMYEWDVIVDALKITSTDPEDVFTKAELTEWALDNDFICKDDRYDDIDDPEDIFTEEQLEI